MKKIDIICGNTDLGVHVDGASLGPSKLIENLDISQINEIKNIKCDDTNKDKSDNKLKNLDRVNEYNTILYNNILNSLENNNFPILIGGDHTVAIASALASQKKYNDIGIIWIDSHGDYNTKKTTNTGNIHGLPLAVITGYEESYLRPFNTNYIDPKKAVIIGGRDIEPLEMQNLIEAGVTIFKEDDLKTLGIKEVINKAFIIANNKSNGVHVSFDLDMIDPNIAKGVSIPAINGISKEQAYEINSCLNNHLKEIVSFDLVEYNPLKDIDLETKEIALTILKDKINHIITYINQ